MGELQGKLGVALEIIGERSQRVEELEADVQEMKQVRGAVQLEGRLEFGAGGL